MIQFDTRPRWWHRLIRRVASSPFGARLSATTLHHLDGWLFRLTSGRSTLTSFLTGLPLIMLTTTGAKSGRPHTVPLLGIPNGETLILIASNWGGRRHPAWYHNLRANPEAVVAVGGASARYLAREVKGQEREVLWRKAVGIYPGYAAYRERTGGRLIPVMLLLPYRESG